MAKQLLGLTSHLVASNSLALRHIRRKPRYCVKKQVGRVQVY